MRRSKLPVDRNEYGINSESTSGHKIKERSARGVDLGEYVKGIACSHFTRIKIAGDRKCKMK